MRQNFVTRGKGFAQEWLGATRHGRIFQGAVASGAAKGVGTLCSLAAIPLVIGSLGAERFGLWTAAQTVIAMFQLADLGLHHGMTNAMAEAEAKADPGLAQAYVTNGFALLLIMAALLGAVAWTGIQWVDWNAWLRLPASLAGREVRLLLGVMAVGFCLTLPLGLVAKVQAGLQESHWASFGQLGGQLLGLALVTAVARWGASLPWLAAASWLGPLLVSTASGVWLVARRPWLRPRWASLSRGMMRQMGRRSTPLLACQVGVALLAIAPSAVITHWGGPEAFAAYSVAARGFAVVYLAVSLPLTPLWPAYADAVARGDERWFARTLRGSLRYTLVAAGIGLAGAAWAAPRWIAVISHGQVSATVATCWLLAAVFWGQSVRHCLSMAANGALSLAWSQWTFPLSAALCLLPLVAPVPRQVEWAVAGLGLVELCWCAALAMDLRQVRWRSAAPARASLVAWRAEAAGAAPGTRSSLDAA
jgi:O-antigen/teichoic acid export membrane protein